MVIAGFQKLTLLDYPGLVACTVFTGGCNMRCPFCHNAALVAPERITEVLSRDELFAFLNKRRGILDGVVISGGEPLLHADLPALLKDIKALGYKIKLDTNGTFPERLRDIIAAGLLDRAAMDIKNSPGKYSATAGLPYLDISRIDQSTRLLLEGQVEYEFRTTAVRGLHEAEDFRIIGQWIAGAREYYIQNYVNSGDVLSGEGLGSFTDDELKALAEAARPYVPAVGIRGI